MLTALHVLEIQDSNLKNLEISKAINLEIWISKYPGISTSLPTTSLAFGVLRERQVETGIRLEGSEEK